MNYNDSVDLTGGTPILDKRLGVPGSTRPVYTFGSSLTTAMKRFFYRLLTPHFVYTVAKYIHIPVLSRALEEVTVSHDSLKLHMEDIISHERDASFIENAKKAGQSRVDTPVSKDVGAALLRTLVQSNMNEQSGGGNWLMDDEIVSDIFVSSCGRDSECFVQLNFFYFFRYFYSQAMVR